MENKDTTGLKELQTALRELAETIDHFAESERESRKDRENLTRRLSEFLLANEDQLEQLDLGYELRIKAIGIGDGASSIMSRLKEMDLMVDSYSVVEADEAVVDGVLTEADSYDKLMLISCLGGESGDVLINAVERALKNKAAVVAVFVTTPFRLEGITRAEKAKRDLEKLRGLAKHFYVFSNDEYKRKAVSFEESFEQIAQAIGEKINEAAICSW